MKRVVVLFLLILSPIVWIYSQKSIDNTDTGKSKLEENLVYIPSGNMLRLLSLGYNNIMADALWMRTSLYFGTHFQKDRQYEWLYRYLDSVTDLDPTFYYPYFFGGLILADEVGRADLANKLLLKGMQNIRDRWVFPFFIGYNYYYYLKQYKIAANFIRDASFYKQAPPYTRGLYVTLAAQDSTENIYVTRMFLVEAYNRMKNPEMKKKLIEKIKKYNEKIYNSLHPDSTINNK